MDFPDHGSPLDNDRVGGVKVYPTPITLGEHVNVLYDGLLHTSGAQEVYLHVGYGPHYNWQKVRDLKMFRTGRGWEQTIEVNSPDRLNFCFKDSAENWDNNSGYNWSFEVHHGKMY